MRSLGSPHLHLSSVDSTNNRARQLAGAGAPHGTIVTADFQSSGRGRQGRDWIAPPGSSLLVSLLLRQPPELLPLIAAISVAEICGPAARIKWPNDILLGEPGKPQAKVAGILCEGRPQEDWAIVGVGLNAALDLDQLPDELRSRSATLGLESDQRAQLLEALVSSIESTLRLPNDQVLAAWKLRDALTGQKIGWLAGDSEQRGTASGISESGGLLVVLEDGSQVELNAGEVHLAAAED